MRTFNLHFEGSILDDKRSSLPTYSGVYLVYCGTLSDDRNFLRCREIIYIGQAEDIRRRHSDHERRKDFLAQLQPGEVLFYSYAKVETALLDRIENALLYYPRCTELDISGDILSCIVLQPYCETLSCRNKTLLYGSFKVNGVIMQIMYALTDTCHCCIKSLLQTCKRFFQLLILVYYHKRSGLKK